MKQSPKSFDKPGPPLSTPREIYEHLDRYVIGQSRAKRVVSLAAYNHLKRISARNVRAKGLIKKSNILLIGPTGSGKTHIARNLAEALRLPFTIVDATEYTEAGYYGKDVEVMVAELLFKSNHSIEDTQRGIIFIDEIDKVARRNHGARTGAGSRDIGGEGVQQALLKLLEGREIFVPLNVTQHWNKHDFVQVDTTDILFICAGTFSDLHLYEGDKKVGFGTSDAGRKATRRRVSNKDLLEYGMLAEFLGRLPVVVELEALLEDDLFQILTVPPDSIIREYKELLAMDDVKLKFSESALRGIVRFAAEKELGARGLRSIVEEVMHDLMFEAPDRRGENVTVDEDYVGGRLAALDPTKLAVER
jgi:ATP-dependent Clp protease ATP-binding subunit ClpX